MKKINSFFALLLICAASALAADVVQTAAEVNKTLPPSTRMQTVIDAVSDITKTDLPAIITKINTYATNQIIYLNASTNVATNTVIYIVAP